MIKKGDILLCISNKNYWNRRETHTSITVGQYYTAFEDQKEIFLNFENDEVTMNVVPIKNNFGYVAVYHTSSFKVINNTEKKISLWRRLLKW